MTHVSVGVLNLDLLPEIFLISSLFFYFTLSCILFPSHFRLFLPPVHLFIDFHILRVKVLFLYFPVLIPLLVFVWSPV